MEWIKVA